MIMRAHPRADEIQGHVTWHDPFCRNQSAVLLLVDTLPVCTA